MEGTSDLRASHPSRGSVWRNILTAWSSAPTRDLGLGCTHCRGRDCTATRYVTLEISVFESSSCNDERCRGSSSHACSARKSAQETGKQACGAWPTGKVLSSSSLLEGGALVLRAARKTAPAGRFDSQIPATSRAERCGSSEDEKGRSCARGVVLLTRSESKAASPTSPPATRSRLRNSLRNGSLRAVPHPCIEFRCRSSSRAHPSVSWQVARELVTPRRGELGSWKGEVSKSGRRVGSTANMARSSALPPVWRRGGPARTVLDFSAKSRVRVSAGRFTRIGGSP